MLNSAIKRVSLKTIGVCLLVFLSNFSVKAFAEEFTIVYTGNSHAALYPCGTCPKTVGGGVTRRATKLKEINEKYKNTILVDTGNFTAGGASDNNSINSEVDAQRSSVYYKVMEELGYEFVAVGQAEFNDGLKTFINRVKKSKMNFVSANLDVKGVKPYYIKEFNGLKVGFTAITAKEDLSPLGLKIADYEISIKKVLAKIESEVDFIVLVSTLGDSGNALIVEKFPQIKVILTSGGMLDTKPHTIMGRAVIFKPSHNAKSLHKINLQVIDNNLLDWEFSSYALGADVEEDLKIKSMVPECFKSSDCQNKDGFTVVCQFQDHPKCEYSRPDVMNVRVVIDEKCSLCSVALTKSYLKGIFSGIVFEDIDYNKSRAKKIINDTNAQTLPIVVLPDAIVKEEAYSKIEKYVEKKGDTLVLKKEISGIFSLLNRKKTKKHIDLFVDIYDQKTLDVLGKLVEFSKKDRIELEVHFVVSKTSQFGYPQEEMEVALAVLSKKPDLFFKYLEERIKNIKHQSWVTSLKNLDIDYQKIKTSLSRALVEENIQLTKDLGIVDGNVILVNNINLFKIVNFSIEDLKKLF